MTRHEARVREVAYLLWEFAGKPEGRDLEFWCKAERSVVQTGRSETASYIPKWMTVMTLGLGMPRDHQDGF